MKTIRKVAAVFIVSLLWASAVQAGEESGEKTQSPYFFVKSEDPGVDPLPLKSTTVHSSISGVIAEVVVTQLYRNEGGKALEAIYVFPASTRAAVHGMKMIIGERIITATIREREKARQEYEQAKQQGKSASLLEQQRPNVFQMNVANILPGDEIRVELRYTELLVPLEGVYEFVYPTVVGPRYAGGGADDNPQDGWVSTPYLHQGEPPTSTFYMTVDLSSGVPIQDVSCTTHKVQTAFEKPDVAWIELDPSERHSGNRDFILRYRLSGGQIETGMILFEGKKENHFLLMVQPPERVSQREIPPREYIFIVDVSGSMRGFPLDISKTLLKDLIGQLRPVDRFNVLLFAGGSSLLSERSISATPENIQRAVTVIERQRGGGGTQLLPALKRALSLTHGEGVSRSVVVVTDGYVRVEKESFDLIRTHLGDANLFAFGIGSSVNRHLIEGMARIGMGEPLVITRPEEASAKAKRFRELIDSPVLTDIRVDYANFHVYDVEPPSLPDVMAERPVIIFGKWRGKPHGHVLLSGMGGSGEFEKRIDVARFSPDPKHSALRYLWARHRISLLSDYNRLSPEDDRVAEVTQLGLAYNLLTSYTSFVAVDERVRESDGKRVTVKQPLPLPRGVSDHAVGGRAPGVSTMALKTQEVREAGGQDKDPGVRRGANELKVRISTVSVEGGLDVEQIRRILQGRLAAVQGCFRSLSRGPHREAKRILLLTLDGWGQVQRISLQTKGDPQLAKCLETSLMSAHFPNTTDGLEATIRIVLQMM
jgi:Ca-activated chloride channel family protein